SDWIATADAQALLRNNRPLLAYVAGPAARFTSKGHNFRPGETVEKQLIVINNSRETVKGDCDWSLSIPGASTGRKQVTVAPGQQEHVPLSFVLPAGVAPGKYDLHATVKFSTGETQQDSFAIDVLPRSPAPDAGSRPDDRFPAQRIALFDPK